MKQKTETLGFVTHRRKTSATNGRTTVCISSAAHDAFEAINRHWSKNLPNDARVHRGKLLESIIIAEAKRLGLKVPE